MLLCLRGEAWSEVLMSLWTEWIEVTLWNLWIFLFVLFWFCFTRRVSLSSIGTCSGTLLKDQVGLEYTEICWPMPPKCWNERHVPPLPGSELLLWGSSYPDDKPIFRDFCIVFLWFVLLYWHDFVLSFDMKLTYTQTPEEKLVATRRTVTEALYLIDQINKQSLLK